MPSSTGSATPWTTFTVQPRQVTGFLGLNGAGKSTTTRMIQAWNVGRVLVIGRPYAEHAPDFT